MKTKLAFCGLLAACCLLFLTGCRSPLQPPDTEEPDTVPATTGILLLTINEQGIGRTIMPTWPARDDFVEFRLDFSAEDNNTGVPNFSRTLADSGTVELYPGIWEMDVTAYLYGVDGGPLRPAAIGTLAEPITVAAGETIARNVMLFPITAGTGTGTFSWDISFPESVAIARIEITRREGSAWMPHSTHYFVGGTPPIGADASLDLPVGLYRVVFALYMEDSAANERAAFGTILHVYRNMGSHFQYAFTYDHFPFTYGRILVAWDDEAGEWDFAGAGITAAHFGYMGIVGVDDDEGYFVNGIVDWLNRLSGDFVVPVDEAGLRALVDAALVGVGTDGDFRIVGGRDRTDIAEAVGGFASNDTPVTLDWTGGNTVTVGIGAYEVDIVFNDTVPLLDADGNVLVPRDTLADQLAWLRIYARNGRTYLVEITRDEHISPALATLPTGRTDVRITLRGIGETRTVSLSQNGSLFVVGSGVTLVLDENVTLMGRSEGGAAVQDNNSPLVRIGNAGTLIMNDRSKITGNSNPSSIFWDNEGGGVNVNNDGVFIMYGGIIYGNNAWIGGGVIVEGTFIMRSGKIYNNAIIDFGFSGGGVLVDRGTFTMYGGIISGNTGDDMAAGVGGVYVDGGTFTMRGGEIYGNIGGAGGGGVGIERGTFAMYGGVIFGNSARGNGGGVNVGLGFPGTGAATFTMHGGTISGNSANGNGGGVFVFGAAAFNMHGGTISGNDADGNGGGVFVHAGNIFHISDGVIYGNDAEDEFRNTAIAGGAALFNNGTAQHGTFANGTFFGVGDLDTEDRTIEVCDGDLIRPIFYDGFVRIQSGTFQMGSDACCCEQPIRSVTVSSFYMSRFQVTQGEWYDVMGTRPSFFDGTNNWLGTTVTATFEWRNLPVEMVSWYDAIVFSNRLSIQRGLTPAYSIGGSTNPNDWGTVPTSSNATWNAVVVVSGSTGYRLPTEAQWEFAARGGIVCHGNYTFSGSNTAADVVWYSGNSGSRTHEVGTRQPNALGLYDMSGNV